MDFARFHASSHLCGCEIHVLWMTGTTRGWLLTSSQTYRSFDLLARKERLNSGIVGLPQLLLFPPTTSCDIHDSCNGIPIGGK